MTEIGELAKQLNDRDIAVLLKAKNDIQKKMLESPTSENIKALAAVNKSINDYQRSQAVADDVTFKNVKEVLEYLQENYNGVKQSTVYYHKKKGLLNADENGFYFLEDVQQYGDSQFAKKFANDAEADNIEQKDKAATEKLAAQAEHWVIKTKILRGEYIERAAFDRALARRAAVFKSDIENFIRTRSPEVIHICKGNDNYLPDVTDFLLDAAETWLDRYAEPDEFEIPQAVDIGRFERMDD